MGRILNNIAHIEKHAVPRAERLDIYQRRAEIKFFLMLQENAGWIPNQSKQELLSKGNQQEMLV